MTITKLFPSGAYVISAMIHGHLVTRTYYGYSRKNSIICFKLDTHAV